MHKSIMLLTFVSCFLVLSIPIIPSAQYIEVNKELEEITNNKILEIEQFLDKIINNIHQKTYSNITFFNIPLFLILIVFHSFLFFGYFFVYIFDDLIYDFWLDYSILQHLVNAIIHTIVHFMDMMYLVTMPGGLIFFLWACICMSSNENWIPPFLCLSLWLQLYILGILLVKFDDKFPLWHRWNTRALGLIEVFFDLDCDECIRLW